MGDDAGRRGSDHLIRQKHANIGTCCVVGWPQGRLGKEIGYSLLHHSTYLVRPNNAVIAALVWNG
jgi:hypothetical protein